MPFTLPIIKEKYFTLDKKLVTNSFLIIFAYVIIHFLWKKGSALGEETFGASSYFLAALGRGRFYLGLIPALGLFVLSINKSTWSSFGQPTGQSKWLKWFVFVLCFVVACEFIFMDINHYYGQNHLFDRLLLFAFLLGILWRPSFIFLFLIQAILTWQHYQEPLGWQYWTDLRAAFEPSILFAAFLAVRIFRKVYARDFLFLALCLLASHYFMAGLAKVLISDHGYEWMLHDKIGNLFVASYTHGWRPDLSFDQVCQIGSQLNKFSIFLSIGTLLLELSFLLVCWRRKFSIGLFIGIALLHLSIFLSSGIFFWPWIIVDISVLVILLKAKGELHDIFDPTRFLLSIGIILGSFLYFRSAPLAWFDSNISTHYEIDIVTDNDRSFRLNKNFLAPYDLKFTQSRLYFADPEKLITDTHGAVIQNKLEIVPVSVRQFLANKLNMKTGIGDENLSISNFELLSTLAQIQDTIHAKKMLEKYGSAHFNPEWSEKLTKFFSQYFRHYNAYQSKSLLGFGMPHHIIDSDHLRPEKGEKITEVEVVRLRSLFTGKSLFYFDQETILRVSILD